MLSLHFYSAVMRVGYVDAPFRHNKNIRAAFWLTVHLFNAFWLLQTNNPKTKLAKTN